MARWSDAMRLTEFRLHREYLSGYCGCYEIGYVRGNLFSPKYIGKTIDLYRRMREYNDENKCHNDQIAERLFGERSHLWFHVIRTDRLHALEA